MPSARVCPVQSTMPITPRMSRVSWAGRPTTSTPAPRVVSGRLPDRVAEGAARACRSTGRGLGSRARAVRSPRPRNAEKARENHGTRGVDHRRRALARGERARTTGPPRRPPAAHPGPGPRTRSGSGRASTPPTVDDVIMGNGNGVGRPGHGHRPHGRPRRRLGPRRPGRHPQPLLRLGPAGGQLRRHGPSSRVSRTSSWPAASSRCRAPVPLPRGRLHGQQRPPVATATRWSPRASRPT